MLATRILVTRPEVAQLLRQDMGHLQERLAIGGRQVLVAVVEGTPEQAAVTELDREVTFLRDGGGVAVVNRVPMEHYVAGTLGREVYPSWSKEMLKAQAVVTRTYANPEYEKFAAQRDAFKKSFDTCMAVGTRAQQ